MIEHHNVRNVKFAGDSLVLTIDGEEREFELNKISPLLLKASEHERNTFEISPSGYGIHWPLLDEDISIDGLLGVSHVPEWQRKSA
ncbi:MAG: DUF2442 domain-containing protein [Syntrophobacteraceae bacterium]